MGDEATGFAYRERSGGEVAISHHGRQVAIIRGPSVARFLTEIVDGDPQQLMARWTGNYRRGNERQAKRHPRNEG
ncbi:MAG: hypothetical protein H0W07_08040 [Chloroflexi bacterium]|nr:hypothetical protein [Chloroflexota bacterium]